MGLLDGLKAVGGGIAGIPGALAGAVRGRQKVMVPIGVDPDTGQPIEVSEEDLIRNGHYDPASGEILRQANAPQGLPPGMPPGMPGARPPRPSLPSMLARGIGAGIHAAAQPGDGTGGVLAMIKGMSAGRDFNQRQDMLAYQMQRQQRQDAIIEEERAARAAAQRARAFSTPPNPNAKLEAQAAAAGLVPGTPEYQAWMRNGGRPPAPTQPKTYEQLKLEQYANEKDPKKRAEIEKVLQGLHTGGGPPKDPAREIEERKRLAPQIGLKEGTYDYKHWLAEGKLPPRVSGGATQWRDTPTGQQQAVSVRINPETGQPEAVDIPGMTRARPRGPGGKKEESETGTKREFRAVERERVESLFKAKEKANEEADSLWAEDYSRKSPQDREIANRRREEAVRKIWDKLRLQNERIQQRYEADIKALGGSIAPRAEAAPSAPQASPAPSGGKAWTREYGKIKGGR